MKVNRGAVATVRGVVVHTGAVSVVTVTVRTVVVPTGAVAMVAVLRVVVACKRATVPPKGH